MLLVLAPLPFFTNVNVTYRYKLVLHKFGLHRKYLFLHLQVASF
jgi:hypothetical protein